MKGYTDTPYNVSIIGLSALLLGELRSHSQLQVIESWYLIRIKKRNKSITVIRANLLTILLIFQINLYVGHSPTQRNS